MNIPIIFEDESLLILNKPAGITVNKSQTTLGERTVQDEVEEYLDLSHHETDTTEIPDDAEGEVGEFGSIKEAFYNRSGIAHRIDKETSGILLVAKTESSFSDLLSQFKNREVHKVYLALAHGRLAPETGEINVPVGRLPWNRRQFGIVAGGKESKTEYEVTGYFRTDDKRREVVSMVKLTPLTGRTHQIRVHLQYLGHPIFSDFLYAGRKTQREDRKLLGRVFLHASEISFKHPLTHAVVQFSAPLPRELDTVINHLVPIV